MKQPHKGHLPKGSAQQTTVAPSAEPISLALSETFNRIFGVDRNVRDNLWPQWRDRGIQICDCGFAIDHESGKCTNNPQHEAAPYSCRGSVRTIQL